MLNLINSPGQIDIQSNLGNIIYDLVRHNDFKNIVDIGTWNGMGTTKCIMKAIEEKNAINTNIYSIELYPDMIQYAYINLYNYLDKYNLSLLNGTIVNIEEVMSWFDHSSIDLMKDLHAKLWYHKDLELIQKSQNVLHLLPSKIDLLILDGGEYSTYPEWQKLKDRTHFFVLDDTNILKCAKIKQEINARPDLFTIMYDIVDERNGYLVGYRNV